MLLLLALFFGPLLLLVGFVCSDAMADGQAGADGTATGNPARYVILVALAVCFVSLLTLVGRTH